MYMLTALRPAFFMCLFPLSSYFYCEMRRETECRGFLHDIFYIKTFLEALYIFFVI